jgi:hypothetical protein
VTPLEEDTGGTDDYILDMHELDPSDVLLLRYAVDGLKKMRVVLEVFRAEGVYEHLKLLNRAGWTTPLPPSVVLD